MKHLVIAGLLMKALAGCGGGGSDQLDTGLGNHHDDDLGSSLGMQCGRIDAMTALSDFQPGVDAAQKAGKTSSSTS